MSDENESELARLQRRFEELLAETERLAEMIRQAEDSLPDLEARTFPDRENPIPNNPENKPRKGAEHWDEDRK